MNLFKRKIKSSHHGEISPSGTLDKLKLKKLDKLYIVSACILGLIWVLLNWDFASKLKPAMSYFSFIPDYFAERTALSDTSFITFNSSNNRTVVYEDHIYYYQPEQRGIFRIKRDGSENEKIYNGYVNDFDIHDGWIYYANPREGLNKMKLDGTDTTLLENTAAVYRLKFLGDNLYYTTMHMGISKISPDGSNRISSVNNKVKDILPFGNYLYYISSDDNSLYRYKFNNDKKKLIFKFNDNFISQSGIYKGWLYYINQNQNLMRLKLNGSQLMEVASGVAGYSIEENKLYLSKIQRSEIQSPTGEFTLSTNTTLYSSEVDGSNPRELTRVNNYLLYLKDSIGISLDENAFDEASFIDLLNNKVIQIPEPQYKLLIPDMPRLLGNKAAVEYVSGFRESSRIIKIGDSIYYQPIDFLGILRKQSDTEESSTISNELCEDIKIHGNLIFYKSLRDGFLYCMNIGGGEAQRVIDTNILNYEVTEDSIYFTSTSGRLYRAQFSKPQAKQLVRDKVKFFQIYKNYIYYSTNNSMVYKVKLDASSKQSLNIKSNGESFDIIGDYIYYYYSGNGDLKSGIYRQSIGDFGGNQFIVEATSIDYYITDKYIFIEEIGEQSHYLPALVKFNIDGTDKVPLSKPGSEFFVDGDTVYYPDFNRNLIKKKVNDFTNK